MPQTIHPVLLNQHVVFTRRSRLAGAGVVYEIHDGDGAVIGTVVDGDQSRASKLLRASAGSLRNLVLEVRDAAGAPVLTVRHTRNLWRREATVTAADGTNLGKLRARPFSATLPLPLSHPIIDGWGRKIGHLRATGVSRRGFHVHAENTIAAAFIQPWRGLARETCTRHDAYEFVWTSRPAGPSRAALLFAMPLAAELVFKQAGGSGVLRELAIGAAPV